MKKRDILLSFIKKTIAEQGDSPTFQEMKQALGINSVSSLERNLQKLEEEGYIRRGKGWKSITIEREFEDSSTQIRIPLLGYVSAGHPIEAIINTEHIIVPSQMIKPGHNYFGLRVKGESMIEENIVNNDEIILRSTATAENGQIIVALIDGENATVKKFRQEGNQIYLIPANRNYETIQISAERVVIQGVLSGLIRRYQ